MKSQPKNQVFFSNLRVLGAGCIKSRQHRGEITGWGSTQGEMKHKMWGATSVRQDYRLLARIWDSYQLILLKISDRSARLSTNCLSKTSLPKPIFSIRYISHPPITTQRRWDDTWVGIVGTSAGMHGFNGHLWAWIRMEPFSLLTSGTKSNRSVVRQ